MSKRKVSNPIAVAREWLARGVMPIPIQRGSHKPKTQHLPDGKGWNKVTVNEDNLEEYFNSGDNVGGLWGKPSGWIVDVDLDWDEAVALAPRIFPKTFMYGRQSRPRSHYLFRCPNVKTFKKGVLGDGGSVIVEVRSTGTQSVLPPSIHPEKERYEINSDTDFAEITPKKLEKLVDKLVTLSILVRNYPDQGRHDYVHAVTGALLWSQWELEEVAEAMSWILDAVGAQEDERDQRERTVVNTIEKFSQSASVNGWPTLFEMSGEDKREFELAKKLATRKKEGRVTLKKKSKAKAADRDDDEEEKPPEDLERYVAAKHVNPTPSLEVPGLIGKLATWVHRTSYADQPIFNLGAAFTILALATQNRYLVSTTNTPLSPFFMALGRTGGGKDSARQAVITAADQIRLAEKAFGGFQSFHALLDELSKPPHVMCWVWDEAARKLRAAAKAGGADSAVVTWLLDLYGKGNSTVLGLPGRKQSISKIVHPFMTVMAFAQPEDMINSITMSDISTGLLNRFILLDAGDEVPPSHYPDYTGFPSHLADALTDIVRMRAPSNESEFVPVGWADNRTYNFMRGFREECRQLSGHEVSSGEIWGRAWQNALILAGLIAVGCNHKKPKIDMEAAVWACDFMRWSCNNWTIRLSASAARSLTERNSKHLERIIREPYAFRQQSKPEERPAIMKQYMPRTLLIRVCRHMRPREIDEAIETLIESDVIGSGTDADDNPFYWWKPVRLETEE